MLVSKQTSLLDQFFAGNGRLLNSYDCAKNFQLKKFSNPAFYLNLNFLDTLPSDACRSKDIQCQAALMVVFYSALTQLGLGYNAFVVNFSAFSIDGRVWR